MLGLQFWGRRCGIEVRGMVLLAAFLNRGSEIVDSIIGPVYTFLISSLALVEYSPP